MDMDDWMVTYSHINNMNIARGMNFRVTTDDKVYILDLPHNGLVFLN